ncbi:hypothetical protein ACFFTQ_37795 [Streptomyces roseofulvus]|uniref:hypothetical protein n=1 Tax=Streptomyces roseofulvus TaxID=33902 RepID=UPI0031F7AE18
MTFENGSSSSGSDAEEDLQAQVLLGRLRAQGVASAAVGESVLARAASAASGSGRRIVRVSGSTPGDLVVLGWDAETAPVAGISVAGWQVGLPPVATLVWAACLRAAWPRPEVLPFPGVAFLRADVVSLCCRLGADEDAVERTVDGVLQTARLLVSQGDVLRLGPAVAALPAVVVEGLRRGHHLLPAMHAEGLDSGEAGGEKAVAPAREVGGGDRLVDGGADGYLVRSVIAALESARRPLPRASLPMLADPALRARVGRALERGGRQLLQTEQGNWVTGFRDPVSDALVAEGTGTLGDVDRAVLALVLLHTVALPRAQGRHRHSRWTGETHTVTLAVLASNRKISKVAISAALRRLRAAGMVAEATTGRYLPGPALDRLTAERSNLLWEDLILVGRPDGHLAAAIRRRRQLADSPVSPSVAASGGAGKDLV